MIKKVLILLVVAALGVFQWLGGSLDPLLNESQNASSLSAQELNLQKTLSLIQQGGPFPYERDGITFQNREGLLPQKPRGYYREYTVDTPGLNHRGPRRVVTGGNPPEVYYYTEDHYQSFQQITP